jgi:hypothetical protein
MTHNGNLFLSNVLHAVCIFFVRIFAANNLPAPPQVASMIPLYYIPSSAQQAGLGSAQIVPPQEHPGPPRMPPPGVMLPGQQPTFFPQQGKENMNSIENS